VSLLAELAAFGRRNQARVTGYEVVAAPLLGIVEGGRLVRLEDRRSKELKAGPRELVPMNRRTSGIKPRPISDIASYALMPGERHLRFMALLGEVRAATSCPRWPSCTARSRRSGTSASSQACRRTRPSCSASCWCASR